MSDQEERQKRNDQTLSPAHFSELDKDMREVFGGGDENSLFDDATEKNFLS